MAWWLPFEPRRIIPVFNAHLLDQSSLLPLVQAGGNISGNFEELAVVSCNAAFCNAQDQSWKVASSLVPELSYEIVGGPANFVPGGSQIQLVFLLMQAFNTAGMHAAFIGRDSALLCSRAVVLHDRPS